MAVPASPGVTPPGNEGFIDHIRAVAASAADYVAARLQLAGLESREAAIHYIKILAWLVIAFICLVFGYIFLCLTAVFLLQHFLNVSWTWIMLGAALFHIAIGAVAIFVAKAKFPKAVFPATIAEFKKDQSWLNKTKPS